MTRRQIQELMEQARARDEKRHAFHRHLLLIASGALSLLVALPAPGRSEGIAALALTMAWPLLGLGILTLAIALHGEVAVAVEQVRRLAKQISDNPADPAPSVVKPRALYRAAEKTAYVALSLAVLALATHGVTR